MLVEVSAQKLEFPPICACCGGASSGAYTAVAMREKGSKTASKSWDFPYCTACLFHVRAFRNARRVVKPLLCGSALGTIVVGVSTGAGAAPLIFLALSLSTSLAVWLWMRKRAIAMCRVSCACPGPAVTYAAWFGANHSFQLESKDFAYHFMRANLAKLINVPPDVWSCLHGGNPPLAQQSARRFVR